MDQKNTWLIKICCIIAAFSLWLYIINETNTQSTQRVTVPVYLTRTESVEEQKLKIIAPAQQYTVTLTVKGSPTDIAVNKDQFRVEADLSEYALPRGKKSFPVRVVRQPANVIVLNSETLFVTVTFDELIVKNFPIKVSMDGKVKDGYFNMQQSISPTEAVVSGAAKFINQVVSVSASADYKGTDKDLNMKLPLRALDAAGREIKEVEIQPANVEVVIPVRKVKTVPITVDTKGTLNKAYSLKTLVPTPDKVEIAGDESINNITALKTEQIDLGTLTPNKVVVAKILLPPGVTLLDSDGTVKVKAVLDNVVEKTFQAQISLKNINETYNATLDNSKLTVTLAGPEEIINTIKNEDFNYTIDASSFTEEKDYVVNINNINIPDGVVKVSSTPQSVKVTVKKKEIQPPTTPTTNPG